LLQKFSSRRVDRCFTTILLEREAGAVQRQSVHDLAAALRPRYQRSPKAERGRILDQFCAATGYHRVYARTLLRASPSPASGPPPAHGRPSRFGSAEIQLLQACWEITDGLCGKRLAPFLGELLARLRACDALPTEATPAVVARVAQMSASTVDRLLRPYRDRWPGRGRSLTKPGTLLKRSVPVRTFADWDEACPGFLEIDLVAHCGAHGAGEFLFTLSAVDVATGWIGLEAVLNKGELAVFEALERLRTRLPFPLLGLDCDNGSEFLNHHLIRWCQAEGITLTRSRPYRKNDNCFIEQKNWSVVRRLVGYARFDRHALVRLQAVYAAAEEAVNFLQPVLKLREKVRDGARITRRYDTARTPYRRLLDHPAALDHGTLAILRDRSEQLHPVRLKLAIEAAQQALYARAVREGPVLSQRMPLEKISL
jgi:hypothetical protein